MQAKKLNDKMLQYILAKCGCEMLTGSEAVALKDHILALEAELGQWPKCQHGMVMKYDGDKMSAPGCSACAPMRCVVNPDAALAAFREANHVTPERKDVE